MSAINDTPASNCSLAQNKRNSLIYVNATDQPKAIRASDDFDSSRFKHPLLWELCIDTEQAVEK